MKKRIFSLLMAICMVLSIMPMPAHAEDAPIYYCGEEHTHEDACLVDPNGATPASEEEPQEETPICTCETACAAGAMNTACAICGAEGATVEGCGKYVAPLPVEEPQEETPTCTCETACAAGAMNAECAICGAEGATVDGCGKYEEPTDDTPAGEEAYEIDTVEKLLQFSSGETGLNAVLTADISLATDSKLTIPSGATLTVPEGMTLTAQGGVENNGSIVVNGTIVLPANMVSNQVTALGITGSGGIKFGDVHIDTDGNCITHRWTNKVIKKDTTNHHTRYCNVCMYRDEETLEPCLYDNVCDTDCNICKIVRTVPHQYGEDGFCTVCHYCDSAAVDSDGNGFLEIDTAQKLWWFTYQVKWGQNELNAELTANIDLAGTCGEDIGNWLPIGNKYSGHFNGQGFTISNLYMTGDELYVGLFGRIYGATIENVSVTGNVSSTLLYDGNYNSAASGGIVAHMDDGTVRNCHVDMTVSGGPNVGGICGLMYGGFIEDCTVNGKIIGNTTIDQGSGSYIGGIVGCKFDGTVRNCVNRADVSAENRVYFGGIAGLNTGGAIENCLNYGTFTAVYDSTSAGVTTAGGIVGTNSAVIRDCGNLGSINISCDGEWTGGIVGLHQKVYDGDIIENCYNVGSITSSDGKYGFIVGVLGTDAIVTNCYYLSDTTTEDGGRTVEQFASGQVVYELNGSTTTDTSVWKQTLGTDSYPTLTGDNVYYGTPYRCDGILLPPIYSNSPVDESVPPHTYDDGGLCSVCGTQVIASVTIGEEVNFYLSFADALSKAEEGSEAAPAVIKLITDITVDEAVTMTGGYVTLDLNGHKLTFAATNDTPFTLIAGTFTIRDSSTAQTGTMYHGVSGNEERTVIALTDSTALVLESGTLDFSRVKAAISVEDGSIMQQRGGKITTPVLMNNGRYELDDGTIETTYHYAFIIDSDGSAWYHIEITGGTVSVNDTLGIGGLLDFPQHGCDRETVTITGGTFKNVANKPFRICVFNDYANVTVTGGTFEQGLIYENMYIIDKDFDVSDFLAPGYAYYNADGNLVVLADGQTEITEKVTIAECTHSFGDYLSDAEGHWRECKVCGAIDTKLAHTPDDDRDCLTDDNCTACGYLVTKGQIIHDFNNANLYDEIGHWHKCSRCDETAAKFDHIEQITTESDGTHNKVCTDCEWVIAENIGHNLTYTASGTVITEACGYEGCTAHTATVTINAPVSPVYNDGEHKATVAYSDTWAGGEIVVTYSGTANDGTSYTAPVKAGEVTASITAGDVTVSVQYTIGKATPDVGTVSVADSTAIYPHTLLSDIELAASKILPDGALDLDAGQTLTVGTKEYDWTFAPADPDNYNGVMGKVSITVVEDTVQKIEITTPPTKTEYTYGESFWEDDMVVTATYASGKTEVIDNSELTITPEELTVATTEVTITYEGVSATQSITVNPKVVEIPHIETSSIVKYTGQPLLPPVSVSDGGVFEIPASEYTVEITNNINVGFATITVKDNAGGNYEIIERSRTFEIIPAKIENVSASQNGTLTYTGNAQTPTVNASATTVDGAAVTFTYCATENGTYGAELPVFTNAGTYTVYFKANAANHEETSGSFEIVVAKATNEWTEAPAIVGWTYGDFGNDPTAKAKFGDEIKFDYREVDAINWWENPPTEAGNYEMRARVQATDNWVLLETIVPYTIAKADPTADIFDFTPPANLDACDGLAKEATVTVKDSVTGVGSIIITYFKEGNALDGAPTTVGTYTVKVDVAEGSNYNAIEDLTIDTFTFDITDEAAHTGVTLVSNGNETHDKVCTVCEKVIESGVDCSGTTTDDCDKGYKCVCGGYFGTKEHDFGGKYISDEEGHWHKCADCSATDTKVAHSGTDDGDCKTSVTCSCGHVITEAQDDHGFDNACDTDCNNAGCGYTRTITHTPNEDDGDCTTAIRCAICDEITTEAKVHSFDNNCDTTCNNKDCKHTRTITHTPNEDDGDCETAIHCKICDAITTLAKIHSFANACDTDCNNDGCKHTRTIEHRPEVDDGDCTTDILCSICDAVTTKGNASHTGGTATCTAKAECSVCGTKYGEMLKHTYTVAQNDGTHHWNKCKDCDAIDTKVKHSGDDDGDCTTAVVCSCGYTLIEAKSHSFDSACDTTCNGCSYTRTITHDYAEAKDDVDHWKECSVCHDKKDVVEHEFDNACDTTCNGCSFTRTITHDYVEVHDDVEHWLECSVCHDKKDVVAHSFDNACDTTCNGCTFTRTTTHDYEEAHDDAEHWTECSVCHDKKDVAVHSFDNACDTTCNGCTFTRTTTHDYAETHDDADHWKECSVCHDKKDVAVHSFDNACDTTCNGCSYTRAITHDYAEAKDDADHWKECSVCGDKKDVVAHSFDNACDTTCNGCSYTRTITHDYAETHDDVEHWKECSICHEEKAGSREEHKGGTATCTGQALCEVCGVEYGESNGGNHEFATEWTQGEGTHYHKCTRCDAKADEAAHEYDNACDTTCNVCEAVRVTTHNYEEAHNDAKHWKECSVCHDKKDVAVHSFDNACDTTCNGCSFTRTITHDYAETHDDIEHWNECSVCHDKKDVAEHGFDNACDTTCNGCSYTRTITHDYAETHDDVEHWNECSVCHDKKDVVVHSFDNACDTTCNGCSYTRTITHDYAEAHDDVEHWLECSVCHDKKDVAAHSFDNACDTSCNGCSYTRTITHDYAETYDDIEHWKECSVCHDKKDVAEHEFDNACDTTCNGCSFIRTITHSYTELKNSDTEHWYECSICHEEKAGSREEHKGGTATCTGQALCEVCGVEYGESNGGNHEFASTWIQGEGTHYHKCTRCDAKADEAAHEYDNACDTTCNVCEAVRVTTHNYEEAHNDAKHWKECSVCHDKKDVAVHSFDNACDTSCNGCSFTRTITHSYTELKNSDTEHWYECSICHEEKAGSREEHKGGIATCTGQALCEVCGVEYGESNGGNHEFASTWTQGEGTHYHKCTRCDAKADEAVHEYDNDCDTTCNVCEAERVTTHNYEEAHNETDHWMECSVCYDKKDVTAHGFNDDLDSTCNGCSFSRTVSYAIIAGDDQSITVGNNATFTSNADFSKFVRVEVDGKTVDSSNYTAVSGSTKVTLKAAYIETLSVGVHTLTIVSTDGSASTTFTVKSKPVPIDPDAPTTGDNEMPSLWFTLLVISAFGALATFVVKRKKR